MRLKCIRWVNSKWRKSTTATQNSEFSQLMHIINLIFYIAMLNVNIEEVICDEKTTTTTKRRKKKKLYTKLIWILSIEHLLEINEIN